MKFSNLNREEMINKLEAEKFDVFVIGGGITGAGIALDASTRGMKTALVEMQDFAAGTSSRSSKLVHGGLRYLKQFELKLVAEVGKERAIVYENGPHVTTPERMLLPIHKGGTFGKFSTSVGLKVYDFLAGVKKEERRTMLSEQETLVKEPLIKKDGLKGGGSYVEYRTDDARLTIEVIKEAVHQGTTALNYLKVIGLIATNSKVKGVTVQDQITGKTFDIHANKIVNAAGPWIETIRQFDQSKNGKTLQLSKGVHLVVDQSRFPLKQAVYFDTPDGRMVFAIPRDGKAYVGTTDTFYKEDLVSPRMTDSDRAYILDAINYMFPGLNITEADVESSWAGIRPLISEEGKDPSEISRKDEIWQSESGLITIAGGKLTGYRKMAETIVDLIATKLTNEESRNLKPCQTKTLPISGGDVGGSAQFDQFVSKHKQKGMKVGLTKKEAENLTRIYGSNINTVYQLIEENQDSAIEYGIPLSIFASLIYAIEHEMTVTPIDFFNRRTGWLLFNIQLVEQYKNEVLTFMAKKLNWTKEEKMKHAITLDASLEEATIPVHV